MSKTIEDKEFLKTLLEHILYLSKGECKIDCKEIAEMEKRDENKASILQGLKFLYEDMELYKRDLRRSIETEYEIKLSEKKSRELEQFSYIASHDMKEPLITIASYSDLLQNKYASQLDSDGRQFLSFLNESAIRLQQLIDGLLEYSAINSNINKTAVDCNIIFDQVLRDLQSTIPDANLEVECHKLPVLMCNELYIKQLFFHLLINAIKYQHPNRSLKVKITYELRDNVHCFAVIDNGIGIKEEFYGKVFDLLSRLHNRSEIDGAGIGLSTCKKIIEGLGGEIWVESVYGEGASFYFRINS